MIIAMGTVDEDGDIRSALNVTSVTWNNSTKWWEITLTGINYNLWDYVTVVSQAWTYGYASYGGVMGKLIVGTFDSSGTLAKRGFSFMVLNATAS